MRDRALASHRSEESISLCRLTSAIRAKEGIRRARWIAFSLRQIVQLVVGSVPVSSRDDRTRLEGWRVYCIILQRVVEFRFSCLLLVVEWLECVLSAR